MNPHRHLTHSSSTFGDDGFGKLAETIARFLGTARYLTIQTAAVLLWIAVNFAAVGFRWDPYPFILLNLVFSTQASYAAPLILLAQTRQAERDRHQAEADAHHREELQAENAELLRENTRLTAEIHRLVSGATS